MKLPRSDDAEWKERPVSKVINMLKEMQAELQNEAELDEEASRRGFLPGSALVSYIVK